MADISKELTSVSNDVYGEQVRTSIKNALNKINTLSGGGVMASISSELNTISSAVYGRDMRSAIHNALDKLNKAIEDGGSGGGDGSDTLVINVSDGSKSKTIQLGNNGKDLVLYIVNGDKGTSITPKFSYSGGTNPLTGTLGSTTFTFQPESTNNIIPNSSIDYGDIISIRFNGEVSEEYRFLVVSYNVSGGESDADTHSYIASITDDAQRSIKSFSDNAKTELTFVNSMSGRTITGIRLTNPNSIAITGIYSGSDFTIPANSNYSITDISVAYGSFDTVTINNNTSDSDLNVRFNAVISGSGPDLQKHVALFNLTSSASKTAYSYSDGRDTDLLIANSMKGVTITSIRLNNNNNVAITGTYSGSDFTIPANSNYSITGLNSEYGDYVEVFIKCNTIASSLPVVMYFNTVGYDTSAKLYDLNLVGLYNSSKSEAVSTSVATDYPSVSAYRLNVTDASIRLTISFDSYTSDTVAAIACDVEEYIDTTDITVIGKSGNPYDSSLPTTYSRVLSQGIHTIYILQASVDDKYVGLNISISKG